MKDIARQFASFRLPRWEELPDIDLYMDQVVNYIDSKLSVFDSGEEGDKIITPTMINNYVKQKLVSPPVMKKYGRKKLSFFMIVAIVKRVLSMSEIVMMRDIILSFSEPAYAYNMMCDEIENSLQYIFREPGSESTPLAEIPSDDQHYYELLAVRALALAVANKIYAQKVIESKKQKEL